MHKIPLFRLLKTPKTLVITDPWRRELERGPERERESFPSDENREREKKKKTKPLVKTWLRDLEVLRPNPFLVFSPRELRNAREKGRPRLNSRGECPFPRRRGGKWRSSVHAAWKMAGLAVHLAASLPP